MAKQHLFGIALESMLETEKIINNSQVAASDSGDFGVLYDHVNAQVDNMVKQKENPVNTDNLGGGGSSSSSDDSSSEDDSGDSGGDDFGMGDMDMDEGDADPEEDADPDADEADAEDKPSGQEATESANLYLPVTLEALESEFKNIKVMPATENEGRGVLGTIRSIGETTYNTLEVVIRAFVYIGINVIHPLLKGLYKVVLYLGAKFIRYTYAGIQKIDKKVEEYQFNLTDIRSDITKAKEIVTLLKTKKEEFPESVPDSIEAKFDRVKILNRIKIGNETNPVVTAKILEGYITRWHAKANRDIEKDSAAIKHVLHYGIEASINPVKTFGDCSMRNGLIPDPRVTHEAKSGFVSSMRYSETLPGDMIYCCAVPNGTAASIEDIRQAYRDTDCSFAIDPSSFKRIEQADYMDLDSVDQSLTALNGLVSALEKQIEVFDQIKREKTSYLTSFKKYILKLADQDKRISLEDSMLEYIYLRNAFIQNVYTVNAMDIQMFTQKYLANVLIYLRSNLEELSS